MLDDELLNFWKSLCHHQVKYIMVGGFATRFHGFNRATDDLDLWLNDTLENRQGLRNAFIELDYGDYPMLETMEFISGWTSFVVNDALELDIMTSMKGLEHLSFDECYAMASIAEIDEVKIPFLHINQLILNKQVVNRPKDQIDVAELEKIKKIREENK